MSSTAHEVVQHAREDAGNSLELKSAGRVTIASVRSLPAIENSSILYTAHDSDQHNAVGDALCPLGVVGFRGGHAP